VATLEDIVARWRVNAAAAGVRLSDADVERAKAAGLLERVAQNETLIARIDGWHATPDYLDKQLAEPEEVARG